MRKKIFITLLILAVFTSLTFGADNYYQTGDSVFSFRAGISVPDFSFYYNTNTTLTGADNMHLKTGGYASLSYQGFISPSLALGGELGYIFNYSIEKEILTMVPITAKLSWYPVQTGNFDLILSGSAGINYIKYDDMRYLSPDLGLTVCPTYYFTKNWGVGIEGGILVDGEFYLNSTDTEKFESSNISGFSPVTVSVSYRH